MIKTVVIVGAGRVAGHIGRELFRNGVSCLQVVNRSEERGRSLAAELGAGYSNELKGLVAGADLYLFAVSDDALSSVVEDVRLPGCLVAHLSGTIPMSILKPVSERTGVFYPLQTFTGQHPVSFRTIPICVEAALPEDHALLIRVATEISDMVYSLDGPQRAMAHLAAVFSCNFTNYLYSVSYDLLQRSGLSLEIIQPLIHQTIRNLGEKDPFLHQTGPASRNDQKVIEKHLVDLQKDETYRKIYELFTANIIKRKNTDG